MPDFPTGSPAIGPQPGASESASLTPTTATGATGIPDQFKMGNIADKTATDLTGMPVAFAVTASGGEQTQGPVTAPSPQDDAAASVTAAIEMAPATAPSPQDDAAASVTAASDLTPSDAPSAAPSPGTTATTNPKDLPEEDIPTSNRNIGLRVASAVDPFKLPGDTTVTITDKINALPNNPTFNDVVQCFGTLTQDQKNKIKTYAENVSKLEYQALLDNTDSSKQKATEYDAILALITNGLKVDYTVYTPPLPKLTPPAKLTPPPLFPKN